MSSSSQHAQQAEPASQGIAATDKSTHTQIQGNESFYEGNFEAAPAHGGDANDSGFFDDDESVAPGTNYKDFTLFPDDGRSELDVDKYQLFADLDTPSKENSGSFDNNSGNGSGVTFNNNHTPGHQLLVQAEEAIFSDAVSEATLKTVKKIVFEVINKDYDIRSSPEGVPLPAPTADAVIDPFRSWLGTHHHHEHLQYLLDQSPHLIHDSEVQ